MKTFNGKEYREEEPHDFNELLEIIRILRSPEGCKWDRAQTHESLKECLTNETREVMEAIDRDDHENLCEELGDVLLQVLLNSQIAEEEGWFTFADVVQMLSEKMIRRHPHVFGDAVVNTPEESLKLWQEVKAKEKAAKAAKAEKAEKKAQTEKAAGPEKEDPAEKAVQTEKVQAGKRR
jgi:tetrapyrrole methylase family protein/MazG family protein